MTKTADIRISGTHSKVRGNTLAPVTVTPEQHTFEARCGREAAELDAFIETDGLLPHITQSSQSARNEMLRAKNHVFANNNAGDR